MKKIADCQVAEVVAESQFALNAGSDAGVQTGDLVNVMRRVQVDDPETLEPLGSVLVPILRGTITLVEESFCIATVTDRTRGIFSNVTLSAGSLKRVTLTGREDERIVKLEKGQQAEIERAENLDDPF